MRRVHKRSSVDVDGEIVGYNCLMIDARDDIRRSRNRRENKLDGNLAVYLPGHVQPVDAARKLHTAIVQSSRAGILWSIDIDPPKGGDPAKAAALIEILDQQVLGTLFEKPDVARKAFKVTTIGWSHGGAEALRAAELAPEMIECVIALCSAGLDSHTTFRLIRRLPREIMRVTRDAYRKPSETLRSSLRFGIHLTQGFAQDLVHTRSPIRLVNDLRWAGKKVVGPQYDYPGRVVILMGNNDAFFHWRNLFPDCDCLEDLPDYLTPFARQEFPKVRDFDLHVLPGNHLAPEFHAGEYLQTAVEALHLMGMVL